MGRHAWQDERDKQLCSAYLDERSTLQEIGDRFGITRERVRQILKQNGIEERYRGCLRFKPGVLEHAREAFKGGASFAEIAEQFDFDCRPETLYGILAAEIDYQELCEHNRNARFWQNATITADVRKCWLWTKSKLPTGYGRLSFNGKSTTAHRVAYELFHGKEPSQWVLHNCDTPSCVNPYHLREGTPQDNVNDRDRRRRSAFHRGTHKRRLEPADVRKIKALLEKGETQHDIAERYGFTVATINRIATGRRKTYAGRGARQYSPDQVKAVRRRFLAGDTITNIARSLKMPIANTARIVHMKTYNEPDFIP